MLHFPMIDSDRSRLLLLQASNNHFLESSFTFAKDRQSTKHNVWSCSIPVSLQVVSNIELRPVSVVSRNNSTVIQFANTLFLPLQLPQTHTREYVYSIQLKPP